MEFSLLNPQKGLSIILLSQLIRFLFEHQSHSPLWLSNIAFFFLFFLFLLFLLFFLFFLLPWRAKVWLRSLKINSFNQFEFFIIYELKLNEIIFIHAIFFKKFRIKISIVSVFAIKVLAYLVHFLIFFRRKLLFLFAEFYYFIINMEKHRFLEIVKEFGVLLVSLSTQF